MRKYIIILSVLLVLCWCFSADIEITELREDRLEQDVDITSQSVDPLNVDISAQTLSPLSIKVVDSSGTNTADVNSDGQLHIVAEGKVDPDNSTSTPLGAGATFTGVSTETLSYAVIAISVYADQDSAVDGFCVQFSTDNSNWYDAECYDIDAGETKTFSFQPESRYYRTKYENGATPQGAFRLQTTLKKTYIKPSSHRISDSIDADDDAELVKAVLTGENPSGSFINFSSTAGGNFKVSLEELESAVSVNSNSQLRTTSFHSDGSAGQLVTGIDYVSGKSGVDSSTESLQVVEYEHHEVHSGSHFFINDVQDLAINNVYDVQWTTPNTTEWAHFTFSLSCESETEWYIYEGATINTAGTSITAFNNHRNSAHTSTATIAGILNTSVANADADTAVAGATQIAHGIVGSGRSGGIETREREIVLKQNTIYCFRAVATAAGYTNFLIEWYEHTDKN